MPVGVGAIARTHRECRENQRGRQSLGDGAQNLVFGHVLRALVGAVEMAHIGERVLVGGAGARHVLEPKGAYGAGVHQALNPLVGRRAEHVARSFDIDGVEGLRITGPEAVQRCNMEHSPASADRALHALAAAQVADHLFHVEPCEVRCVGTRFHQCHDFLVTRRSWRVTAEPMNPLAPVTSTRSPGDNLTAEPCGGRPWPSSCQIRR